MNQSGELQVSPTLRLPISTITHTFAYLAMREAGKSNALVVLAEEMFAKGLPWVAIDPKGDWWGIRADGDGGPGLPVLVFGGEHGDVPLEPTSGRMMADLIVDRNLTCVLDLSLMDEDEELPVFVAAFLKQLYLRNRDPRMLFLEEADVILPQVVTRELAAMVKAASKILKMGRTHGLGCTLATQRTATLHKNALSQVETLVAMRTTFPPDRDRILDWVKSHQAGAAAVAQLAELKAGEAFIFSPSWLGELIRIRFRRRNTYDSGATPEVGQEIRPPTDLASVDLGALRDAMAATIERAEAEDPERLRKRIAELERQLTDARSAIPEPVVQRIEVPAMAPETVKQIIGLVQQLEDVATAFQRGLEVLETAETERPLIRTIAGAVQISRQDVGLPPALPLGTDNGARESPRQTTSATASDNPPTAAAPVSLNGSDKLGKAERQLLTVLAQHGPRTHAQLALQAGYSPTTSTISVSLGKLRRLGYVEPGQPITATQAGIAALGELEPMPTGRELLNYWMNKLGKAERLILEAMLAKYPNEFRMPGLAMSIGYSPATSTIGVALGKLRRLELVEGWKISDAFAGSIR